MLTDEELAELERRILQVVLIDPRTRLLAAVPRSLQPGFPDGESAKYLVRECLQLCIRDQWNAAPPSLVIFLDDLLPGDAFVAPLIDRLRIRPEPADDPFEAVVLDDTSLFLDRREIRDHLRALTTPAPVRPFVVVNGLSRTGKTHTHAFIDFLRRRRLVRHCRIMLPKGDGSGVGPLELARDLMTGVGGDPDALGEPTGSPGETATSLEPPTTNLVAWTRSAVNKIITAANKSRWWFVLDGFNNDELRPDTLQFIVKFASALTVGVAGDNHRLILLDFDRTRLLVQPGSIATDTTAPIAQDLVRVAVTRVVEKIDPAADAAKYFDRLVQGLPDPIVDLGELGARFRLLVEA